MAVAVLVEWARQARDLIRRILCYFTHLVTGEEYQLDYVSTEDSALEILDYIKEHRGGKLFAIGGVSLGGQIAMELLSLDSEIAEKAIIVRKPLGSSTRVS